MVHTQIPDVNAPLGARAGCGVAIRQAESRPGVECGINGAVTGGHITNCGVDVTRRGQTGSAPPRRQGDQGTLELSIGVRSLLPRMLMWSVRSTPARGSLLAAL